MGISVTGGIEVGDSVINLSGHGMEKCEVIDSNSNGIIHVRFKNAYGYSVSFWEHAVMFKRV